MPSSSGGGGKRAQLRYGVSAFVFVFTGIVQTVCMQAVLYESAGQDSIVISVPIYMGNVMVFFAGDPVLRLLDALGGEAKEGGKPAKGPWGALRAMFHPERRKLFVLGVNEVIAFNLGLLGLARAGSGIYTVVLSGTTVFTALLATLFLRKRMSVLQWLFLAVITSGLVLTAGQINVPVDQAPTVINGIILTLVSCLFYASNFVIAEHFLSLTGEDLALPPPSGSELAMYTHGTCFVVFTSAVIGKTLAKYWADLVHGYAPPLHEPSRFVAAMYIGICLASFLHAVTYYDSVQTLGAVSVGIMGAVRAVLVFGASAVFFCVKQASQCYSTRKGVVTAVVFTGAIGYSLAARRSSRKGK